MKNWFMLAGLSYTNFFPQWWLVLKITFMKIDFGLNELNRIVFFNNNSSKLNISSAQSDQSYARSWGLKAELGLEIIKTRA